MKKIIFGGVITIFFLLCLLGCKKTNPETRNTRIPYNATNVVKVGDYWLEFTYKNDRYLYKAGGQGGNCITKISK